MKATMKWLGLILVLAMAFTAMPVSHVYADTVVPVYVLDPSWDAAGGGGVFSAYIPTEGNYTVPGAVGLYDGREAGIIKAGLRGPGLYDEGLFGFKPDVTIDAFAAATLSYDVETQAGVNPVWMTIEIDTGVAGVRDDNVTYQHVPTSNPAGWHTVDAAAGSWQKWNNGEGDTTGNPLIPLSDVVTAHSGLNVVRAYLRLGMGDSYYNGGTGTIAWVDKVALAGTTYDFQVQNWFVSPTGSDSALGTESAPFATIQHAIDVSTPGDTVNVLAGTYVLTSAINVNKGITLNGVGNPLLQVSGTGSRINMHAVGATLQGFQIEKTDHAGTQNIIYIDVSNVTIQNNKIWGHYVIPDAVETSRAMEITGGLSGLNINHNEIFSLRQPAYINGTTTGTVSDNFVYLTKGWVVAGGNLTFTNNTWGTGVNANVYDIAILAGVGPLYYTDVLAMSAANNNAIIEDQRNSPFLLSSVYVDGAVAVSGDGTPQSPKKTVQEGINRVIPGGNVYVAAGTYPEAVSITKNLHLIGANNSTTIIKAPASLPISADINSAVISVVGTGVRAEINGFTISGPGPSGCGSIGYGIFVRDGAYANIHDNKILDVRDQPLSGCQNGNAIQVGRNAFGTTGTATITNNLISSYQKTGIVVDNTGSNAIITGNTITGVGTTDLIAQNGIQISRGATATLTGNTISGNSFHNAANASDWGSTGILIWTSGSVSLTGGNNLSGNDTNLYIESPTGAVTVGAETFGSLTSPLGKGYQVANYSTYPLNLTSVTMGGVDFSTATPEEILPFAGRIWDGLDDPTLGVATLKANYWFVDQGGTIQAAIKKATAGDTILVAAGTYPEIGQIVIDKNLTIFGENTATTIIKPAQSTGSSGDARGWFLVKPGVTFNLSNFTLDGTGFDVYQGIRHLGSGTINQVNFTHIQYPGYMGVGVAAMGGTGMNVNVTNSTFAAIGRIGVIFFGTGQTGTFDNNTYVGKGAGDWLDYGVEVGGGASAIVTNSNFSNCLGVASTDHSTSAGVLATTFYGAGTGATVRENTFSGNTTGIAVGYDATDTSTVSALKNKFLGSTDGITSTGPSVDADGNWWGTFIKSEIQAKIDGPVVFEPYYLEEAMLNLSGPINTVFVDDNFTTTVCGGHYCGYDAFATIKDGINAVASGGTVKVAAGTYTEVGQIIINKNVSLVGADKATTIIKPDANYTNWIIVEEGKAFSLSNFTLDGNGKLIRAAIRTYGSGSITNNIIKNMYDSVYNGWGIAIDYAVPNQIWNISNNTFENIQRVGILVDGQTNQATLTGNTFIGKGSGDWVNYGIEVGDGAHATITGNSFESYKGIASSDGSTSAGILVTSYFGPNPIATITNNTFKNNSYGISLGYLDTAHVSDSSSATATGNTFTNNDIAIDAVSSSIINIADSLASNTFDRAVTVTHASALLPSIFGKIQLALDAATAGDTVNVAAGTYVGDLTIDEPITLLGPNADINPNTGTRLPEAVILPSTSNPDPTICTNIAYLKVSNITIKGFTIDGNNPQLTSGILINGQDVDACEVLSGYEGMGNIVVENNILKNATYAGIDFYNYTNSAATSGNYIRYNLIQNIGTSTYGYGMGVVIYNNFYADVTDNVFDMVRVGVQTGNFYQANPGSTGSIKNNVINSWMLGIFHNLWYTNASTISISNNTINAVANADATKWNGMLISSIGGAVNTTIDGNIINIPSTVAFAAPGYTAGYNVWNDTTTAPLTISGGTVTGGNYGAFVNNYEGYSSDANNTSVTISGVKFDGNGTGIYVLDSPQNTKGATVTATLNGNIINGSQTGVKVEGNDATATGYHNQIVGSRLTDLVSTAPGMLDFDENWWGSMFGPASVTGNVDFVKWCGNAECSILLPDDNNVITLGPGTVNIPGGMAVNQPHLTITLANGTVVQNDNASCFDIHASYTTILAETIGGAKCIPAEGKNGINVDSDLKNIIIDNIEFAGQAGNDGIHFNGAVTDVQIVDNWIHDLAGNGLTFLGQPTGYISIQGNLFQNNTGKGIEAGSFSIPAKFNSWGNIKGAIAGDGKSTNVDSDPFTHVDLYVKSTASAPVGGQVTYTVYGNLKNVYGASFTLKYPTSALTFGTATNTSGFVAATGPSAITVDETAGTISFDGVVPLETPALSGVDLPIFTVVFTQKAGDGVMDLMETTDRFSMFPTIEPAPSNNIYAAALVDGYNTSSGFAVTGSVTMQGRPSIQSGVPAALVGPLYNFYTVSINGLSDNLVFTGVAGGTYTFTTNQPRYLNVTSDLGKTVLVSGNRTLPSLELKGGNANNDSVIDVRDASLIGSYYKLTPFDPNADVNFDGVVDIRDLTLMSGNWHLTSTTAYATWLP